MTAFKDHFSSGAADYARFRPVYPDALIRRVVEAAPGRGRAWDCGTGNGQVAVALAPYFAEVVATDPSAEQIAQAFASPGVAYRCEAAEKTSLMAGSVDLVVVAQALHWFDLDAFYGEVRRVAAPGCVLAVWCYGPPTAEGELGQALKRLHDEVLGPWWPAERWHVVHGYCDISFPFAEAAEEDWTMPVDWSLADLVGYVGTWSALGQYRRQRGEDIPGGPDGYLRPAWGERDTRRLAWPVRLRLGRVV